ncbi:hypothetical protein [Vibrio nigripulchritudo]|uniref:hypothetical protein n=1 Tax=Vibrio nigripulchritudo TaxID=28173 RepID=UPI0006976991|nr:hypothetical protein [Vibrio nigripulchritudo]
MKMNLSVLMNLKDKVSAPLKGMSSESDHYAKKIKKIQKAQADDSAAMGMIDSYKQLKTAQQKNNIAIKAEIEKLKQLKEKAQGLEKPSAQLTEKIAKQTAKLNGLTKAQDANKTKLSQLRKHFKKTGVQVSSLDDEYERLSNQYKNHGQEITKLEKRYIKLQRVMKPISKMNGALKMPTIQGVKNGAMAASGVLASMTGFGFIISDTATRLDEMASAANDVKMPISELQAIRLQAKLAGAESEDMDAAIREMMLRWGEMKSFKSGAMNDYFKDTGNQKAYQDLMNAKDVSEAYQVLLREIANEKDVAKQNFMADEFFGGDSEKMLAALRSGVDGYNNAKQLLQDSGGPVTDESSKNAQMFAASLKKLSAIVGSLKISALTPIMAELSFIMEDLALKMKNMDWREGAIAKLRDIVSGTFNTFKFLGSAIMFVAENFKGIVAAVAIFKVALIGLNAVIMANPIGMIVTAVTAAIIAITYLVDKFVGLEVVIAWVGEKIEWLWNGFKKLINKLPDALIPDGWKAGTEEVANEVDNLANKLDSVKDKNVEIGVTNRLEETRRLTQHTKTNHVYAASGLDSVSNKLDAIKDKNVRIGIASHEEKTERITRQTQANYAYAASGLDNIATKLESIKDKNVKVGIVRHEEETKSRREHTQSTQEHYAYAAGKLAPQTSPGYQMLSNQNSSAKSEISLTIKSDKPVAVDRAKVDKQTELNMDVGNMALSY